MHTHTKRMHPLVLVEISFYLFITAPSAYKTPWLSRFLCSFLFTCAVFFFFQFLFLKRRLFYEYSKVSVFLPTKNFFLFVSSFVCFCPSYCPIQNMINFAKLWNWTFLVLIAIPLKRGDREEGKKRERLQKNKIGKKKKRKIKNGVCSSLPK